MIKYPWFAKRPLRPRRFAIVTAVYNVSTYLEDFFASLEGQSYGIENLELILVDDGSTDGSLELCRRFAAKWPKVVRVLHQENQGQGSARNTGLRHVRSEWVVFSDPDDFLDPDYFGAVDRFLRQHPKSKLEMLSTSYVYYFELDGTTSATHPLHFKFTPGSRIVDLGTEPENIQLSSSTAFFRTQRIARHGLQMDDRVRPTFEDAHFIALYLLSADAPRVGIISEAVYHYRKRADKSSSLDTMHTHPGKYTAVPQYGFVGALEHAHRRTGGVPLWLQNTILYDLSWMFRFDAAHARPSQGLPAELTAEFHRHVATVFSYISPETVAKFSIIPISDDIRFVFATAYRENPPFLHEAPRSEYAPAQPTTVFRYRYSGEQPHEALLVDDQIVQPTREETRSIVFFDRDLAWERTLEAPAGEQVALNLDDRDRVHA